MPKVSCLALELRCVYVRYPRLGSYCCAIRGIVPAPCHPAAPMACASGICCSARGSPAANRRAWNSAEAADMLRTGQHHLPLSFCRGLGCVDGTLMSRLGLVWCSCPAGRVYVYPHRCLFPVMRCLPCQHGWPLRWLGRIPQSTIGDQTFGQKSQYFVQIYLGTWGGGNWMSIAARLRWASPASGTAGQCSPSSWRAVS